MSQRGNTIAVLLGASSYPSYPSLDSSPAFANSKSDFLKYLTSRTGLGLSSTQVLDLFDSDHQPGQIIEEIRQFLEAHISGLLPANDVIFYYCGHGAYLKEREYFLALKCTKRQSKEATIFKIGYLVDIIAELTSKLRNLVILDACYSGGAMTEFGHLDAESDAAELLNQQISVGPKHLGEVGDEEGTGTVLFCAAGPRAWAKSPSEGQHTMFSGALLEVLRRGESGGGAYLSLKRMADLVKTEVKRKYGSQGVQPQVHVPVQEPSDILNVLYFPNPSFDSLAFDRRLENSERQLKQLKEAIEGQTAAMADLSIRVETRLQSSASPGVESQHSSIDLRSASDLTANPAPAEPFPSPGYRNELGRLVATVCVLTAVDAFTFFLLQSAASTALALSMARQTSPSYISESESPIIGPLLFAGAVHLFLLLVGVFVHLRQTHFEPPPRLLRLFPPGISYLSVAWNSFAVCIVLCYVALLPRVGVYELLAARPSTNAAAGSSSRAASSAGP